MLNFLLNTYNSGVVSDVVSGDNVPDIVIAPNIFEEYGFELWGMFVLGIFVGIILACIYFSIKVHFYNKSLDKQEEQERQEQSDE